jgi:carboxyl-terminal processing protease
MEEVIMQTRMNISFWVALSTLLLSPTLLSAKDAPPQAAHQLVGNDAQIQKLLELYEKAKNHYVDEVEEEKFWEGALKGAMRALDPHSDYLTPKEFDVMRERTKGEFAGIGIEMIQEYGVIKVISPIDDTPAYNAGIKAGDYIIWIDGEPVMGMNIEEAARKLRGQKGTAVQLRIVREGRDPYDVTIKRDIIKVQAVKHRIEGDIGYIRISTFNEKTEGMLKDAIVDIKKKLKSKLQGVIVDLRNNPGGLLEQSLTCADLFLDSGEIVSVRGRDPQKIQRFNASAGDILHGYPIAILINAGSASCSEIFAAALQDHKRAIIMGNRSFGKGSVQVMVPNSDKLSGTIMTIARYYPPSGYPIQGNGVTPDVIINQAKVEHVADMRRREENLPGALKPLEALEKEREKAKERVEQAEVQNAKDQDASLKKQKINPKGDDNDEGGRKSESAEPAKLPESEYDYQLARALDLLKAYAIYSKSPKKANVTDTDAGSVSSILKR